MPTYEGPGWFANWVKRKLGTLGTVGGLSQAAHVADAAAATAVVLDDDTGATADAEADIVTVAALTENAGAIGGTNDGDLPALVDPAGDAGASVIAGIRENAAKINALKAAYDINFATIAVPVNALIADVADIRTQLNALIASLETAGLKASA